jgi:hypothetical protein
LGMSCDMDLILIHANPELDWCKRTKLKEEIKLNPPNNIIDLKPIHNWVETHEKLTGSAC